MGVIDVLFAFPTSSHDDDGNDKDGDGYIKWTEFLDLIVSEELAHRYNQYGTADDLSVELQHSLMRVFEQEMLNQLMDMFLYDC